MLSWYQGEPHEAFALLTRAVMQKWKYLIRGINGGFVKGSVRPLDKGMRKVMSAVVGWEWVALKR